MTSALANAVMEMDRVSVASAGPLRAIRLDEVTWTVKAGEFWVVGGLPGSGKSDLLATAAGLIPPEGGHHRLFGRDTARLPEDELVVLRSRVGFVFSYGGRLFQHLTVEENVALAICYHQNRSAAEATPQVQKVLECVEIKDLARDRPDWIPRHLHPRVALARALALKPELLILDNPLAGLGPRETRWWLNFLSSLAAGHRLFDNQPLTLIVGTENLQPWRNHGRQFALIQDKRWLPLGNSENLQTEHLPLARELFAEDEK